MEDPLDFHRRLPAADRKLGFGSPEHAFAQRCPPRRENWTGVPGPESPGAAKLAAGTALGGDQQGAPEAQEPSSQEQNTVPVGGRRRLQDP